jgi:hypothetical protein
MATLVPLRYCAALVSSNWAVSAHVRTELNPSKRANRLSGCSARCLRNPFHEFMLLGMHLKFTNEK